MHRRHLGSPVRSYLVYRPSVTGCALRNSSRPVRMPVLLKWQGKESVNHEQVTWSHYLRRCLQDGKKPVGRVLGEVRLAETGYVPARDARNCPKTPALSPSPHKNSGVAGIKHASVFQYREARLNKYVIICYNQFQTRNLFPSISTATIIPSH